MLFKKPKILGLLNPDVLINEIDKLSLRHLGSELLIETASVNLGMNVKF